MPAWSTHRYNVWCLVFASTLLTACSSLPQPLNGASPSRAVETAVKIEEVQEPVACIPQAPSEPQSTLPVPAQKPQPPQKCRTKIIYQPVQIENKLLIGEVENVTFPGVNNLVMKARIDTGAETSSLHTSDNRIFERDGSRWVSFTIALEDGKGVTIERPLIRTVLIKQKGNKEPERRPVVMMKAHLGNLERVVEFTLANREGFEFPALLGRNFLKDIAIVDVSHDFLATSGSDDTE